MKLNFANPVNGAQKTIDVEDEAVLRCFYDQRMSSEILGDDMQDEQFKGYVFRISGGNDAQGFPMKQGVLLSRRVRLLLKKGQKCYRQRRSGERKRKSVRGCIVGPDLAVLNLVVVKVGDAPIPGLTSDDINNPLRLGPKRASKIRKLFNLGPADDVRKYVVERTTTYNQKVKGEDKGPEKTVTKRPKIQRLVTPLSKQHKRRRKVLAQRAWDRAVSEKAAFQKLLKKRNAERRQSEAARRSSRKRSRKTE
jgi:small subunit ribosomal protein S6e